MHQVQRLERNDLNSSSLHLLPDGLDIPRRNIFRPKLAGDPGEEKSNVPLIRPPASPPQVHEVRVGLTTSSLPKFLAVFE